MKQLIRVWLLLLLLIGCTTTPTTPSPPQSSAAELHNWVFEGRLAITDGQQSWQSSIKWEQQGEAYSIDLVGALGQGQISIRGDADGVTLRQGDQALQADDPDQLLAEATGLSLPISSLRYWLLGLATPTSAVTPMTDAEGRLRQLQQAGWLIHYPNYIQVDDFSLPQRLRAVHDPFTVQLLIRQWILI
jgi:outer membrane lipoprotein LolB